MVELVADDRHVRLVADANDEPCPDGCGLSAHECVSLHDRLVARAIEILMRPQRSDEIPRPWLEAA